MVFVILVSWLFCENANSESNNRITIRQATSKERKVSVIVGVLNSQSTDLNVNVEDSEKRSMRLAETASIAQNVWILVDSSPLCRAHKVDQRVQSLVRFLKSDLPAPSVVSVVGFTNTTSEIYASQRPVADLEEIQVDCDAKGLSASFENPLLQLMKAKSDASLPVSAWVFTSGNLSLSNATLKAMRSRGITLRLILYNPILEKDLAYGLDEIREALGPEQASMTSVNASDESLVLVPERRLRVEFTAPASREIPGQMRKSFTVVVGQKKEVLGRAPFVATIVQSPRSIFIQRCLFCGLILISLISIVFVVYRIVKYYRQPSCPKCKRLIRRRYKLCLYCAKEQAFFVGKSNWKEKIKRGKLDVIPVNDNVTTIGSQRRCDVPVINRQRRVFAKVVREYLGSGKVAYQLISCDAESSLVRVNGYPVADYRYLGEGDEISVGGLQLIFTIDKKESL
jgi:hypothetical protein